MTSEKYEIRAEHNLAPGHRFLPSDVELMNHYLKLKMLGYDDQVRHIAEIDIYEFEPWELPSHSQIPSEEVWYFFSLCSTKFSAPQHMNRTTKTGYWQVTGRSRKIKIEDRKEHIGVKKTFIFYQGSIPNGVKTNWTMQEYIPSFNFPDKKNFVICKIKRNGAEMPPAVEVGESGTRMPSSDHKEPTNSYEEDAQMQIYLESFLGYNKKDYNLNAAMQF